MAPTREQIVEWSTPATAYVDAVSGMIPAGNVTHLIFTCREPSVNERGKIFRSVQVRLIVPNDRVQAIGRVFLGGALIPNSDEYDLELAELEMVH